MKWPFPRGTLPSMRRFILWLSVVVLLSPRLSSAEGEPSLLGSGQGWDYFSPLSSALEPGGEPVDPCPARGGTLHSTGDDARGNPTISCETPATGAARAMSGFLAALASHRAKKGEPSTKTWERIYAPFASQVQCGAGAEVTFDGDRFVCLKTFSAKQACPADAWSDAEKSCRAKSKCPKATRRVPAPSGLLDEDQCVSCPTGASLTTWQNAPACRESSTSARSTRRRARVCSEEMRKFFEQQVQDCGFLTAASKCSTATVLSACLEHFAGCGPKACRHQLNVFADGFEQKRDAR